MGFFGKLQSVEKKYALTSLGFMLAAVFGGLSIYTSFFVDANAHIRYRVVSVLSVYDIHEDVGKLDIIYDGINIREKKQMISLITVNVSNVGHGHVTKGLYDNNAPLGFKLNGGILLKSELFQASNSYLSDSVKIRLESKQKAYFSPVIIDSGESFSVKILALHNENQVPEISPVGKIAGVKEIELIRWAKETSKKPFWREVISGGILTHITRAIGYFLALLLGGIAIGLPTAVLSEYVGKRRRKKHVLDFKSLSEISLKQEDDCIFESYINGGESFLVWMSKLVSSKEALKSAISYDADRFKREDFIPFPELRHQVEYYAPIYLIRKLLDSGFVRQEKEGITVNSHMQDILENFLRFLKGRGVNLNKADGYRLRAAVKAKDIKGGTEQHHQCE
ncbi:MAG: hypothetical protein ACYST6_01980 [Planctomycetota bacterium]